MPKSSLFASNIGFTYSSINSITWLGALPTNLIGSIISKISSFESLKNHHL